MPKFRKKPVEIEAIHYDERAARTGWGHEVSDAHPWLDEAYDADVLANIRGVDGNYLRIRTLEGDMRANVGDWVIRGIKGEIYACKPDIFAATYDAT